MRRRSARPAVGLPSVLLLLVPLSFGLPPLHLQMHPRVTTEIYGCVSNQRNFLLRRPPIGLTLTGFSLPWNLQQTAFGIEWQRSYRDWFFQPHENTRRACVCTYSLSLHASQLLLSSEETTARNKQLKPVSPASASDAV